LIDLLGIHTGLLYRLAAELPGGPRGWAVNRLIFRDWWHWRDHELQAALGNIALTGQNEGGKSSLLALAATLLDGDTSPRRLDPSQTADRYIHYFLLGKEQDDPDDPEVFAYKARVGYLALEFRHGTTGRHLTIGMGINASRGVPGKIRNWWGFILPGARLGVDFDVRGRDGNCVPYGEFRQLPALGLVVDGETDAPDGAAVLTTERKVYRRQVNEHLFQMTDDDYRALIEVLLSARRPKIAQATQEGPEKVCRLLRDSLPPLPTEPMDNLSQVIYNLESHQRDLKDLEEHVRWVGGIDRRHLALVEALVQQAAREYGGRLEHVRHLAGQIARHARDRDRARRTIEDLDRKIAELTAVRTRAQGRLAAQKVDAEDLPRRLAQARNRAAATGRQHRTIGENLGRLQREMDALARELERIRQDFAAERDRLVLRLAGLARTAGDCRILMAAGTLETVGQAARALAPDGPPGQFKAARPDAAALSGAGEEEIRRYRKLRESLATVREKERLIAQGENTLKELRVRHQEAVENIARAEDALTALKEQLAGQLGDWWERHPELSCPDHHLAQVRGAVLDLAAVPESGARELLGPLRADAAARSRELQSAVQAAMIRAATTGEKVAALEREAKRLAQEGLRPPGAAGRRTRVGAGTRLFHEWIDFRPETGPEVSALVEAALLEAGILDLAVPPGGSPAAGAWLWAGRPVSGPSLAILLTLEDGAPPVVAAALSALGWGEGNGDHWVAADGHWRHGLAEGRVEMDQAPGLVGAARRQRALEERLAALRAQREELAGERAREEATAREYQAAQAALEGALAEVEGLKWQPLFRAIRDLDRAREDERRAAQAVENAKAPARDARQALEATRTAYADLVAACPETEGLDDAGLESLIDRLKDLARDLRSLAGAYDSLERMGGEHARKTAELAGKEKVHEGWRGDGEAARREWETAQAEMAALEERINQPDVVAAMNASLRLAAEVDQLGHEIKRAEEEKRKQEIDLGKTEVILAEREPEAEKARRRRDEARDLVLARLALHPSMAPLGERLSTEAEPTRAFLQALPRPVADEALLAHGIEERRAELMDWVREAGDDLQEYGLSPSKTYDRVDFRDEGHGILAPVELHARLAANVTMTRGLIDEEERNLYEEIICNDLVDGLIDLMAAARDFTGRMNRKLYGLRASSGAYFAFKLELVADSLPGVRIGQSLLAEDKAGYLSGERRQNLAVLIRNEVERARQEAKAQNRTIDYLEAIQETLDYRRWYEFQVFRKDGRKSERLRNRGFGALSGFARSWTLAVPVIAGVAARYDAARNPDVPRLVFLDEIFAGFDTGNQATYLRFLHELNLNWIIADPDDLPYSDDLPAVMSYQMSLSRQTHTAYPTLWDGAKVTDPAEIAALAGKAGEDVREES
jgi:energy-coupling factor transporter ATP-binding protein EcfA2